MVMTDSRIAARIVAAVTAAMAIGMASPHAAELQLLSAGAVTEAASAIADRFRDATGHDVRATFGTVGTIEDKLRRGAAADVLILSAPALEAQERAGKIVPGSRVELARVGIGVAIGEGAPHPDIATTESFRRTLLAAKSVVYADPAKGASSGIYFAALLDRLGIADAIRPKATLLPGGYVVELVARGGAELGVHQISEILPVKGVSLVGPLPPELQNYTIYAAGVTRDAAAPDIAAAFVKELSSPAGQATFAHAGFEPPG
jgi:molybdate transport system substrate-binding protein